MKISGLFVSKKTQIYLKQLYKRGESEKQIRLLGKKKASLFICIIAVSFIVSVPVFIKDEKDRAEPLVSVIRNGYMEGPKTYTLRVLTEDGYERDMTVDIGERRYTEEELEEFSKKLDEELWRDILGKNTDPGNVRYDLDLMDHINGYPFRITWKSDHPLILSGAGVIDKDRLEAEDPGDDGISVRLCATLKYKDQSEDKYSYVVVHKPDKTAKEAMDEIMETAVKESEERSETDETMVLPVSAGGRKITFYRASANRGWAVLFFGTVTAFLMMAVRDRQIKDEAKKRKKQMDSDHPRILDQYMLYYIAGMNPRAIWAAICSRYEDRKSMPGSGRRYAYEEMLLAKRRMDEGCGEISAYDEFAARCDNVRYRSFISLVKQAVIKGNDGLDRQLGEEVEKAQKERTDAVKAQAAEAETKLLFPMFLMLLAVIAVVTIPAFIGFGY